MGFLGGGSGSASNTLSNVINFNPVTQVGESQSSDLTSKLDQRASSEATAKDQQSASVGVGVGGGSGSGGYSSLSDAGGIPASAGVYAGGSAASSGFNIADDKTLLIGGAFFVLFGFLLLKKKK